MAPIWFLLAFFVRLLKSFSLFSVASPAAKNQHIQLQNQFYHLSAIPSQSIRALGLHMRYGL